MDPLITRFFNVLQNGQSIMVGVAHPTSSNSCVINGKKVEGYARGQAIAYWDKITKKWKVV